MAADESLKGQVLGLLDDIADKAASDQQATDQVAIDNLQATLDSTQAQLADVQAEFDAYKQSHPDQEPPPPPPPPPAMVVLGASLGEPLTDAKQVIPAVRVYQHNKFQAPVKAGTKVVVYSVKDAIPDAMVAEIKAAPSNVTFYCTVNHEPDDDIRDNKLTVDSWGAKMNAFGRALAPLPNVHFGPIHNGSFGKAGWVPHEASCDKTLWDFWGMDRYCFKYEDPATQYAEGTAYAKSLGLPILIGETAAPASDAAKQLVVAQKSRAWALDPTNNVAVDCWWQAVDETHGDLTFANADVQHAFLG